jgi:hypothetical protein
MTMVGGTTTRFIRTSRMPESGTPTSSPAVGGDDDADTALFGFADNDTTDRLRQAWRDGVASGGYQPAEAVFARLQARYETLQNDA